jgi:ATP-binding protein involved in chromosome partitioning
MVMSALEQLLFKTAWGDLDFLLVDMPPGTGDAQLTLTQRVTVNGALIVSTPQEMALVDARRAIAMFDEVRVPIVGLVENMASTACPACGTVSDIFGSGGVQAEADKAKIDFLASIPLAAAVRRMSDAGTPLAARPGAEETAEAAPYFAIADMLLRKYPTL